MKSKYCLLFPVVSAILLVALSGTVAVAGEVPRMTPDQLKAMLGEPDVTVLDVRTEKDWQASDKRIMGAGHRNAKEVEEWAKTLDKGKTYVLYCS